MQRLLCERKHISITLVSFSRQPDSGISTLIATFGYDLGAEITEARLLLERGAEALVLVGERHRPELYEMLDQFDVPLVNTYVHNPDSAFPSAGFNNAAAAAKVARHLVQLGHTEFSVISGITKDNDRTTKRLEGIREELSLGSIELPTSMIIECPYTISGGRAACAQLLSRGLVHPTAMICGNDVLALGALIECQARGLEVPRDISVVGFDNLELSQHSTPSLTTIDVPAQEMGTNAAHYVLETLSDHDVPQHNSVECQLILRESTAPPKARM
jgi:LacI family transcriptional regulator